MECGDLKTAASHSSRPRVGVVQELRFRRWGQQGAARAHNDDSLARGSRTRRGSLAREHLMVQGLGFRVLGSGIRVEVLGFRVQGLGLRVESLGFEV